MARIEVTEASLRAAVDERVFTQAMALTDKLTAFSAVGPQVTATVDGIGVSVRVRPGGLDARCACPAAPPCPHAVAAALAWIRTGGESGTAAAGTGLAAELRADLDDVLDEMAEEAADCEPGDGWYSDTGELEDLLDEIDDLADAAPATARELAAHAAERIRQVLAAAHCLAGDLAAALTRAEDLTR